jgi:predicted RNase H-like HicB family nuclease
MKTELEVKQNEMIELLWEALVDMPIPIPEGFFKLRDEISALGEQEKDNQIILLSAEIHEPDKSSPEFCGWINEVKGCIAQEKTLEKLKESLLDVYWIKRAVESKMAKEQEKEQPKKVLSPEEILKDNLSDYYWELIEGQTTLPDHEKTLKKWILIAMEDYHSQFEGEGLRDEPTNLRAELKELLVWIINEQWFLEEKNYRECLDEYLKTR